MRHYAIFTAFLLTFITIPAFSYTGYFNNKTPYSVCFTPGQNCTQFIVGYLNNAQESILIQAYSLTSAPIAKALVEAKNRGVDVKVILDKSQTSKRYTIAAYLSNNGIPVWIDYKPAIAHNKVIVIDGKIVSMGSFNYTKAANNKNAENIIFINDSSLASIYIANWNRRQGVSYKLSNL